MIQRVGDRALEQLFHGSVKRLRSGEKIIESLQGIEEALNFVGPGEGLRIVPSWLTSGHGKGPIEEITDMSEDLKWCAAVLASTEVDIALRSIANDFATAIRDGGQ